ncbi:hypothetical protein KC349_g17 [Hortaea werneckii]|nr:hypothetical protein KC349_g17 [Hortaea werneckii]
MRRGPLEGERRENKESSLITVDSGAPIVRRVSRFALIHTRSAGSCGARLISLGIQSLCPQIAPDYSSTNAHAIAHGLPQTSLQPQPDPTTCLCFWYTGGSRSIWNSCIELEHVQTVHADRHGKSTRVFGGLRKAGPARCCQFRSEVQLHILGLDNFMMAVLAFMNVLRHLAKPVGLDCLKNDTSSSQ